MWTSAFSVNQRSVMVWPFVIGVTLVSGCGGGDSSSGGDRSEDQDRVGYFIDSAVEGLEYEGDHHQGLTGEDGSFIYREGTNVFFSVGSIGLGSVEATRIVTPMSLVNNGSPDTPEVIDMARFLLMIDSDGDPSNGIQISAEAREAADDWVLEFGSTSYDEDLEIIRQELSAIEQREIDVPSDDDIEAHITHSFFCAYAGAYEGTYSGGWNGRAATIIFEGEILGGAENFDTGSQLIAFGKMVPSADVNAAFGGGSSGTRFAGSISGDGVFSGSWEEEYRGAMYKGSFKLEKENLLPAINTEEDTYLLAYDTLSGRLDETGDVGLLRVVTHSDGTVEGEGFSTNRWLLYPGQERFDVTGTYHDGTFTLNTAIGSFTASKQPDGRIVGNPGYVGPFGSSIVVGCRELVN